MEYVIHVKQQIIDKGSIYSIKLANGWDVVSSEEKNLDRSISYFIDPEGNPRIGCYGKRASGDNNLQVDILNKGTSSSIKESVLSEDNTRDENSKAYLFLKNIMGENIFHSFFFRLSYFFYKKKKTLNDIAFLEEDINYVKNWCDQNSVKISNFLNGFNGTKAAKELMIFFEMFAPGLANFYLKKIPHKTKVDNQFSSIEINYISSNGNLKTLTSTDSDPVKDLSIKQLYAVRCQVCYDVHEKPLQVKCCESVICASCYSQLLLSRGCPSDRSYLTGSIERDLKVAGRLLNYQIELCLENFHDVQSTETDMEKSRKQNDAIAQINSVSQQNTSAPQSSNFTQDIAFPVENSEIGLIFNLASYFDSYGRNSGQASHINPIRVHEFRADDVAVINVYTAVGHIIIEGQNSEDQAKVSIISSKKPSLSEEGALSLDCAEKVNIKVPELFIGKLELKANYGCISTLNNVIRCEGHLHTNTGYVKIEVDTTLVAVTGISNLGITSIAVRNFPMDWERKKLSVTTCLGDINVFDNTN
ncbi:MAG: hypothetical protein PUP46_05615 [Endozoicomonas sp. (ex Botrylloides leachii)]|nr:hypothetical protein [Endozoicomonas sp. (ex Botrylloides leachii)]